MKEETEDELRNVLSKMQYNGGGQIKFSDAKQNEEVRKVVVDRPKERRQERVVVSYRYFLLAVRNLLSIKKVIFTEYHDESPLN